MADVNVTFLSSDWEILGGAKVTAGGAVATVPIPPLAALARIVSPSALRMRLNREDVLSSENGHYTVIPPAMVEFWPVEHGQFLHFTGDAFGVVDEKQAQ